MAGCCICVSVEFLFSSLATVPAPVESARKVLPVQLGLKVRLGSQARQGLKAPSDSLEQQERQVQQDQLDRRVQ